MSIHAVHAGAERTVCYIVVSTETPQTTTNPSQTLLPVYKLAHLPLPHSKSSPPTPPPPPPQDQILNPAGGLKCGLVFIYIHTLRVRAVKVLMKL